MTGDTNDEDNEHAWARAAAQRLDAERATHHRGIDTGGLLASTMLTRLMSLGLGIMIFGGILFFAQWPQPDTSYLANTGDTTGDIRWAMFGLAIASLGGLFSSIACIGFGVSLGVRDADERRGH